MSSRTARTSRDLLAIAAFAAVWIAPVGPLHADVTYVVRPGDGFFSIAAATGVAVEAILDANDLQLSSVIHPGQRLTIPHTTTTTPTTPASANPQPDTITVRPGDGLITIARRAGTDLDDLLTTNQLTITSVIHPGQRLTIPHTTAATTTPTPTPATQAPAMARVPVALPRDVTDRSGLVPVFVRAADEAGIPADLLMAVCYRESRWRPRAVSPAGASGVCQLMPPTAAWIARDLVGEPGLDSTVAEDNIRMAAHLLAWLLLRADGDVALALAMYAQGVAGVERDGISPFSRRYHDQIADLRRRFT